MTDLTETTRCRHGYAYTDGTVADWCPDCQREHVAANRQTEPDNDSIIDRLNRLESIFRPGSDACNLVGTIIFDIRAIRLELLAHADSDDVSNVIARKLARCAKLIEAANN